MKDLYTVGEMAKEMGVSVRTLQYYDKISLLKPSAYSEGGRRLYSHKDMIRLHQILSLKYLGFSLEDIASRILPMDTPQEVLDIMRKQKEMMEHQVLDLQAAISTMQKMEVEIEKMGTVDFQKYADIISMIRIHNQNYWIVNCFDDDVMTHLRTQFKDTPQSGVDIFNLYQSMVEEAMEMKSNGIAPDSAQGISLGKRWWAMVMDFTKGDMSLISKLVDFNNDRSNWDPVVAKKQNVVNEYIQQVLEAYFIDIDQIPEGIEPYETNSRSKKSS